MYQHVLQYSRHAKTNELDPWTPASTDTSVHGGPQTPTMYHDVYPAVDWRTCALILISPEPNKGQPTGPPRGHIPKFGHNLLSVQGKCLCPFHFAYLRLIRACEVDSTLPGCHAVHLPVTCLGMFSYILITRAVGSLLSKTTVDARAGPSCRAQAMRCPDALRPLPVGVRR